MPYCLFISQKCSGIKGYRLRAWWVASEIVKGGGGLLADLMFCSRT